MRHRPNARTGTIEIGAKSPSHPPSGLSSQQAAPISTLETDRIIAAIHEVGEKIIAALQNQPRTICETPTKSNPSSKSSPISIDDSLADVGIKGTKELKIGGDVAIKGKKDMRQDKSLSSSRNKLKALRGKND